MADEKIYIIDPLTAICKLALLHFMPIHTRLSISHHVLHIQEVGYMQFIERIKNRDNRLDISSLISPIIKTVKWYVLDTSEKIDMDDQTNSSIRTIIEFAIKGLHKMQKDVYNGDDSIGIIIQYLINLLQNALDNTWTEDYMISIHGGNNVLSDKIKNNFDFNTINFISKTLFDADQIKDSPKDVNILVDCVHKLLMSRDEIFVKLMKDVNTTL